MDHTETGELDVDVDEWGDELKEQDVDTGEDSEGMKFTQGKDMSDDLNGQVEDWVPTVDLVLVIPQHQGRVGDEIRRGARGEGGEHAGAWKG